MMIKDDNKFCFLKRLVTKARGRKIIAIIKKKEKKKKNNVNL